MPKVLSKDEAISNVLGGCLRRTILKKTESDQNCDEERDERKDLRGRGCTGIYTFRSGDPAAWLPGLFTVYNR